MESSIATMGVTDSTTGVAFSRCRKLEGKYIMLSDGSEIEYRGRVRLMEPDSLAFWTIESEHRSQLVAKVNVDGPIYDLAEVTTLNVITTNVGLSVLSGVVALAGILTIGILATGGYHQQ